MRLQAGAADPKDIRAQLTAYLEECAERGTEPASETWRLYAILEKRIDPGISELSPWNQQAMRTRFNGQVLRELNARAASGTLVKQGQRGDVRFYTAAAVRAVASRREKEQAEAQERRERTQALRKRLEALGLEPDVETAQLTLEDLGFLVSLAEKGQKKTR